ncbi:MAG TPA: ribosomal protein S18-alanine N-acetyltransferase [Kineosporiaceae bacterium]|jgi:[ribosomal protein S18]-alanine N-acetyltransferase|nr:ribosomal protein S18-alanine N-acetyltransferase [Kineosporiaceae bacterium]
MTDPAGPQAGTAPAVTLRALRWWDVERLIAVEQQLFGLTAWTAEAFWAELAQPRSRWYVVAEGSAGELLGYAGLMVSGSEADVQTVAVAPGGQRRGLGSHLVDALVDQAVRRGAASVLLEVRADNAPAIRLYRRHGFEQISIRRRYYQPGDVDALIMRLALGTAGGRRPAVGASDPA